MITKKEKKSNEKFEICLSMKIFIDFGCKHSTFCEHGIGECGSTFATLAN